MEQIQTSSSIMIDKLNRLFHSPSRPRLRIIVFIFCFSLGLVTVHEIAHVLIAGQFQNGFVREIILFPFLTAPPSENIIIEIDLSYTYTSSTLAFQLFFFYLGHFFVPLGFSVGYILLFRKRLTSMEIALWLFIGLLMLRGDFLNMYRYLIGGIN